MQPSHISAHEIELLEAFVHDCVYKLPKLHAASRLQLPASSSTYYMACSSMIKEVLIVLERLSPRLCRLIGQIWDLTSLNFFALVQLAHAVLEEQGRMKKDWRQFETYQHANAARHADQVRKAEAEMEIMRVECRELRAEMQKTRQKTNRLAVENSQLRQALSHVMELQETLAGTVNEPAAAEDVSVVGSAEEWELFGVKTEDLDSVEKVHPLESIAQDFEQLFQSLFDSERAQVDNLNELDRFMNSNVVALLWRHGSDEEEHKFLQKMMNLTTMSTQTDPQELGELDTKKGSDSEDDEDALYAESSNATAMTKRQVIPPSLRAQLTTRPKIQRVLEKDHLNRVLLRLYLEKMEADSMSLRRFQGRVHLHRFMKEYLVLRYGIAPLADYHMMEIVKSCLYYNERQEVELRKRPVTMPTMVPLATLAPFQDIDNLNADDARVALFGRISELLPLGLRDQSIAGNLFGCAVSALLDAMSDLIEADAEAKSLKDVVNLPANQWEVDVDLALAVLAQHLSFVGRQASEEAKSKVANLASAWTKTKSASRGLTKISVDVFLVVFMSLWFEYDLRLARKLHEAFRKHFARSASMSRPLSDGVVPLEISTHGPIDTLRRIWQTVEDESFSILDNQEIEKVFLSVLDAKNPQRRRSSTRRASSAHSQQPLTAINVGGVTEKEFVFHMLQVLRLRRTTQGIRTNGKTLFDPKTKKNLGGCGRPVSEATHHIELEELKPGLTIE
ncbi:TPA: hypothetical protein N0F65_000827 [Lagenidium giganteum]|uniref:Uncharacterized protein n=1 Tax=Lagenidium giganteum TaxID=4803 RepID=A0AAV2YUC5_9STRA|nr:TPA: hypothetical protein N0F65_000827 [Lagenidium giganteum]